MPKIVDSLPKSERGREKRYEWLAPLYEQLADNDKAVELVEGEDFTCKPSSMRQFLYRDAPEHGFKVRVRTRESEDGHGVVTFAVERDGAKATSSEPAKGKASSKPQR
jgi:hypothetical protein